MTGKANKMLLRVCALLLCALLLSGCRVQQEYPPQLSPSAATPPPVETDGTGTLSVTLYYRSADGQLSSEQRDVEWPAGVSRAQAALKALCDAPESAALNPVIPEGLTFERVELSGDVCDVYLTGELPDNGQSLLVARAAIAATVQANEGIPYIDVYVKRRAARVWRAAPWRAQAHRRLPQRIPCAICFPQCGYGYGGGDAREQGRAALFFGHFGAVAAVRRGHDAL